MSKNDIISRKKGGQFRKGVSGNPKGRPPKKPTIIKDLDEFVENGKHLGGYDTLKKLMETETDRERKFKYAKELAQYEAPKLTAKTVEAKVVYDYNFQWIGSDGDYEDVPVIEHEPSDS